MADDNYDVDFDIDLNDEEFAPPPDMDSGKQYGTAINYEEEWNAERRRHEATRERLYVIENENSKLKLQIANADIVAKSSTKRTATSNNELEQRIVDLEEELRFSMGAAEDIRALKSKSINLVERIRIEKKEKARAEADVHSLSKKIDMLSVHIEKLMIHLKHEAAAKIKAMDSLRGSERRCNQLYDRNDLLTRKVAASNKCVHELREGSKILEDQLRLMDEKYLELREKLDYSRGQAARKVEIAQKKASSLRVKYALLGNSTLLDNVDCPAMESPDKGGGSGGRLTDPATNSMYSTSIVKNGSSSANNRASVKNRAVSAPKVRKMNMTPGFTPTDRDKAEEVVLDKIRRNRGRKTVWTDEKLKNLTRTSSDKISR